MKQRALTMLLHSGNSENEDSLLVIRLAEAALKNGYGVNIFLCGNGVYLSKKEQRKKSCEKLTEGYLHHIQDHRLGDRLEKLLTMGANVATLSANEYARGIDALETRKGIRRGDMAHSFCSFLLSSDVLLNFGH